MVRIEVKKSRYIKETLEAYLFLLPSLVILGTFVIWPIFYSFFLSFFKWNFENQRHPIFIGIKNYTDLFTLGEPLPYPFSNALIHSLYYVLMSIVLILDIALIIFVIHRITAHSFNRRYITDLSYFTIVSLIFIVFRYKVLNTLISYQWMFSFVYFALVPAFLWFFLNRNYGKWFKNKKFLTFVSIIILYIVLKYTDHMRYGLWDLFYKAKEESDFIKSIYNTFYYVFVSVPITVTLGLLVALLLNMNVKFRAIFRSAYFIPFVTSIVAVSLVWQWIYNDDYGLLNYILSFFGTSKLAWLKDEKFTIPTIIILSVWKSLGYDAVIFLAGLQSIDRFYYEAADIDGASRWQKFKYITWPLLSPTTFFILIISIIGAFKVFTQVYVLYNAVPGPYNNSGLTILYYVFQQFYVNQKMGYASAAAYVLFAIILVFTIIQLQMSKKRVHYEA